jgi:hypothetical protein
VDLSYLGRGLLGSWPQPDAGVVLWSLSGSWDKTRYAMEAKILLWFGLL